MEHLNQIQRAIDFIEINLSADISIDEIAREAAISKWHFQIIFSSVVGDTVKEYIRKRRLTNSLRLLKQKNQRIIEISIASGFSSQEAYTRAFKNQFGMTPGQYREIDSNGSMILQKAKITMEYIDHLYGGINMQALFRKLPQFEVVGLGVKFISILSAEKNNHIVIPKLWDEYLSRQIEITNRTNSNNLGICMPIDNEIEKSHSDECFYLACTEVKDIKHIPQGMITKTIPAGDYAVFTHKGHLHKLDHSMNYIYGSWLPKSGRKLREAPDLELYDHRFSPNSEKSELDIYIPIN